MNRKQAVQYAEFINSLCESGNLKFDWLDSLDSEARDHVFRNPSYIGHEEISVDDFENHFGGYSILGFFDIIEEEHLFDYYYFVSNSLADPLFQRNNKDNTDIDIITEQSSKQINQSKEDNIVIDEDLAKAFLDNPASYIYDYTDIEDTFTGITDEASRILSGHVGELNLYGLTGISDSAAEILSEHKGPINLESLTNISDTSAVFLSRHGGPINLEGLTEISDTVAEALSNHEDKLSLYGLKTLSDAAAKSLSKHDGNLLINGLIELSNIAAETLSMKQGFLQLDIKKPSVFSFNGLSELTDKLSDILADSNREINLPGVIEISDQAAANIAESKGAWLHLNGVKSLSDCQAENLSRFSGDELSLNSLTEISDMGAKHLSNFCGKYLFLKKLTEINHDGIHSLASYKGNLRVPSETRERIDSSSQ